MTESQPTIPENALVLARTIRNLQIALEGFSKAESEGGLVELLQDTLAISQRLTEDLQSQLKYQAYFDNRD